MNVNDGLRAWARGSYAHEAGVELLIASDMAGRITAYLFDHDRDDEVPAGFVWPDVHGALTGSLGLSGGEHRLLRLVANLLGQEEAGAEPLNRLSIPNLAGLDRRNTRLAIEAFAHALGAHQMGEEVWPWER